MSFLLAEGEFAFVAAGRDHLGIDFGPPVIVGRGEFLDELGMLGGKIVVAGGVGLAVEEDPAFGRADAPMILRVAGRVGSGFQSFADCPQGRALAGVFLTLRITTIGAAQKEMVALTNRAHGVFVGSCQAAGPAGNVVKEQTIVLPIHRAGRFEQRNQTEVVELASKLR